jgi:ribose transport system substrate-binding protein
MKRVGMVLLVSLVCCINIFASGQSSKTSKEIALLPMTLDNEFYVAMKNGAEEVCRELGYTLTAQSGTGHGDAAEQLRLMETMIQKRVAAILITPSSSSGIVSGIKQANEANIPVIILDTEIDTNALAARGAKTLAYLGSDNYKGGQAAGEYAKKLSQQTGKVLNAVILTGVPGQENMELRKNGFIDAAGASVKVVATQNADSDFAKGNDVMTNLLTSNSDIDLVYSCNDNMALGALRACQERGKNNILIIGFDGTSDALNSIKANGLAGTVAQVPAEMGGQGVRLADMAIKGQSVPAKTYTPVNVIDKSSVDQFIDYVNKYSGK